MLDNDLNRLIKILEESNIDELEVSTFWGRQKIRLRKNTQDNNHKINTNQSSNHLRTEEVAEEVKKSISKTDELIKSEHIENIIEDECIIETDNSVIIKAPLVGTFYKSAKPENPPFISEGDEIKEGQTICIIEAMKIFNEIESEYSGKVIKILVEDATPVEYDQDLLIISPE